MAGCVAGFYTDGPTIGRTESVPCRPGTYCPGDGRVYPCPVGRYGDVGQLASATCSGQCLDGALCTNQSISATGVPCPAGAVCIAGLATLCPRGTYNPSPGASNASTACLPCGPNTYNPNPGSSSSLDCTACPAYEGSAPGASSCWPGIMGAYWAWACLSLVAATVVSNNVACCLGLVSSLHCVRGGWRLRRRSPVAWLPLWSG